MIVDNVLEILVRIISNDIIITPQIVKFITKMLSVCLQFVLYIIILRVVFSFSMR